MFEMCFLKIFVKMTWHELSVQLIPLTKILIDVYDQKSEWSETFLLISTDKFNFELHFSKIDIECI